MSQTVIYRLAGEIVQRELPDPDVRILNDITWGEHCCLFDVAVLHGAPRLDQDVANAMRLRPGH